MIDERHSENAVADNGNKNTSHGGSSGGGVSSTGRQHVQRRGIGHETTGPACHSLLHGPGPCPAVRGVLSSGRPGRAPVEVSPGRSVGVKASPAGRRRRRATRVMAALIYSRAPRCVGSSSRKQTIVCRRLGHVVARLHAFVTDRKAQFMVVHCRPAVMTHAPSLPFFCQIAEHRSPRQRFYPQRLLDAHCSARAHCIHINPALNPKSINLTVAFVGACRKFP